MSNNFINYPSIDDEFVFTSGDWIINLSDDDNKKYINVRMSLDTAMIREEIEKQDNFNGLRIIAASRIR